MAPLTDLKPEFRVIFGIKSVGETAVGRQRIGRAWGKDRLWANCVVKVSFDKSSILPRWTIERPKGVIEGISRLNYDSIGFHFNHMSAARQRRWVTNDQWLIGRRRSSMRAHDHLDPQQPGGLVIPFQFQAPKVSLVGALDPLLQPAAGVQVEPVAAAEDGFQPWHVQRRPEERPA
jgi:hypothetical protein